MKITDLTAKSGIKEKKSIDFKYFFSKIENGELREPSMIICNRNDIVEIIYIDNNQQYKNKIFDLIYIRFKNEDNYMFLGHWNDGIL